MSEFRELSSIPSAPREPPRAALINLSDGSASWAPELSYTGITNLELRLKASVLTGKVGEEFREKRNRFRLELRARYFF